MIGDHNFLQKVIAQAEEKRLRISRFEKEGCDLEPIAVKVGKRFDVSQDRLRVQCRGGKESDARKVFVYVAAREYKAPSRMIADYCGVGIAAVSFMARAGYSIVKRLKIDILLF